MKILLTFILFFLFISCTPEKDEPINDNYNLKISLNSDLKLELTWDSLILKSSIKNYEVYKSIKKDDNYIKIASVNYSKELKTYKYTDDFIISGSKTYYYKIRAITTISNEEFSQIVSYKATEDIDGDGFTEDDCAANLKDINPGETEICDGIDNNCNENIDEGIEDIIVGSDTGECRKGIISCVNGKPETIQEEIKPSPEICDNLDNNCNGETDENIGDIITGTDIGECQKGIKRCVNHQLVTIEAEIKPAAEICDGKDNDCNNKIDDNIADIITGTDTGECQKGIKRCVNHELVTIQEEISPENEQCNNLDDNCNGLIDDELYQTCSNVCETGESICIEGHWLGCDAVSPQGEEWTTDKPARRTDFAHVTSGRNTVFIFGGKLPTSELTNDLWQYNESTNIWKKYITTGNKPIPRVYSSMTYKHSAQEIYLYGGIDALGNILNDFWKFDIENNSWIQIFSDNPINARLHGASLFNDGFDNIFLFGGKSDNETINNQTYKYSITQNKWSNVNSTVSPSARFNQTLVFSPSTNYFYIFGGHTENNNLSNELWKFNLTTFEWSLESSNSSIPEVSESSAFAGNNKLYFFGGKQTGSVDLTLYIYNLSEQTWQTVDSQEDNIISSVVLNTSNNTLTLWGGNNNSDSVVNKDLIYNTETEEYSAKRNISSIYKAALTYDYVHNKNYLFGGFNEMGFSNDLWEYSPSDNSWKKTDLGIKPEPREAASLTYSESDNSLYLYGGRDDVSNYGDLWKLDLNSKDNWEHLTITNGPSYRTDAYLFYKNGEIYLFGGRESEFFTDLYKLNLQENKWEKVIYDTSDSLPESRENYSVIYSPGNDYLFLFGGQKNNNKLNDLWVLDLSTKKWITFHIGIVKPSQRSHSKFLYDYENNSIYLFGGINNENKYLDDIWSLEIGANNWTKIKPNSNYYAFNERFGMNIFWVNTSADHFIYVLGGKDSNDYFYLPNKINIVCDEN